MTVEPSDYYQPGTLAIVTGKPGAGGEGGNPNIRGTEGMLGLNAFHFGLLP